MCTVTGFCIYEFVHLLKFIFEPQISPSSVFEVIHSLVQNCDKFELPKAHACSQLRSTKGTLHLLVSDLFLKHPVRGPFSAMFFSFVLFLGNFAVSKGL